MNERVAPSFALSFLVVALAAVALYRPDPPPPTILPQRHPVAKSAAARPAPARELASAEDPPAPSPPPAVAEPGRLAAVATPVAEAVPPAPAPVRPVSRRQPIGRPRSAFTRVARGESLADVARRVYGSAEATRPLWLANRDQVARLDQPLREGTLLRTP
jgi:nucleoid-associated protein YgaU